MNSRSSNPMSQSFDNFRTWISLFALVFVVLTTSVYTNFPWLIAANAVIAICLAAIWLVPSDVMSDGLGRNGVILALLAISLAALQMLPLPAAIWQVLPGRDFEFQALGAVGHQNSAMPFTLSPHGTSDFASCDDCRLWFFLRWLGISQKETPLSRGSSCSHGAGEHLLRPVCQICCPGQRNFSRSSFMMQAMSVACSSTAISWLPCFTRQSQCLPRSFFISWPSQGSAVLLRWSSDLSICS